jgi:hypothetical protein
MRASELNHANKAALHHNLMLENKAALHHASENLMLENFLLL